MVYTLLIREQKNKNNAWDLLNKHADKEMPVITKKLIQESAGLDEILILPLLELCVNALRELSLNQYKKFKYTIESIIESDKIVDLNEWVIQRLVLQQLDEHFAIRKPAKEKYSYLGAVKKSSEILLSLIAYVEHQNDEKLAKMAFVNGINNIGSHAFNFIEKDALSLDALNTSIDQLMQLKPLLKSRILKACVAIILTDGKTTRKGMELFRIISISLDCPTPLMNI